MDIENLKEGQIIKNYKELCTLLGMTQTTGNSKISQLKELERYITYHKEGNKFVVDEIFSDAKPKQDKRYEGLNSYYGEDLQALLLQLLMQSNDKSLFLPCARLLQSLSMVNCNYSTGKRNIPKLSNLLEINENIIYDFYNTTHSTLRSSLETTLKQLARKSLISWCLVTTVCKNVGTIEINDLNEVKIENGVFSGYIKEDYREATEEEEKLILSIERDTLLEMGYDNKREVFLKGKAEKFYSIVNDILKEKGNIAFYYKSYKIIYNHNHVKQEFKKLRRKDVDTYNVNLLTKDKLITNAHKRHFNSESIKELYDLDYYRFIKNKDVIRADENYICDTSLLIDTVIDIKSANLINEIHNATIKPKEDKKKKTESELQMDYFFGE